VSKWPSDNVKNFVEIEKNFIFGKNYHMSEQNFVIFEKNYAPQLFDASYAPDAAYHAGNWAKHVLK
jgi:hypothetical protein